MSKVLVNETSLTGIADAIRSKNGTTDTYFPADMAQAILSLPSGGGGEGLPEEAFTITGTCDYRFASGGWDWFINEYGNQITTKDISSAQYMFSYCTLHSIPFDINGNKTSQYFSCNNMFGNSSLRSVPRLNIKPSSTQEMFSNCHYLRNIDESALEGIDWSRIDNTTSSYDCNRMKNFAYCSSLRSLPMEFLNHGNPAGPNSYSIYNYGFTNCYTLDEIVGLPNPHLNATWTSNAFNSTFSSCHRLKNMTFATPDGQPYVVNWKNQTIDLATNGVGYGGTVGNYTIYNSGITADKQVTDDATYQALKDDPDWFSTTIAYSRYNHDSAVATINSLPDTSAYLATAGGTNTIKFDGIAGSATDGGAINTLTEEEIAVATAKGWTVTLV